MISLYQAMGSWEPAYSMTLAGPSTAQQSHRRAQQTGDCGCYALAYRLEKA